MSKHNLIDMVITEKCKKVIYTQENNDLTKEQANELLKNNNFAKKELRESNISTNSLEVKARPKPFNN